MDRIADVWGERTPFGAGDRWPERTDQFLAVDEGQVDRWVRSACPLCSNGCGLDIAVTGDRMVGVRGRAADRINHGRLGPKGLYGWQANSSADRLTRPLVRVDGELRETDTDTAMTKVVERSRQVLDEHGRLAMAFYTSGQLFAEEYYTQCLIARGGIGTPHLDGNTRLCTATAEWALIETFGSDGDPGSYTDIDACDTLFLVGHNVPETQTVLWARMLDRLDGPDPPRLVVVDPRRTSAAARADVHLAIRPGTNVALLNAILHEIIANDWADHDWMRSHTVGYDALADADRTVHLSEKAIEPPGEARSDLDILLDYASRMNLRDKDGSPLVPWTTPEQAWNAFTAITRGRPCDQSALTYAKLRSRDGIQWPCTQASPDGTERLYADHRFATDPDYCEDYGHDLLTGADNEADEYRAHDPAGRAILKAAEYLPPHEPVDDDYPLQLTTGRTTYQWHTRTKTRRVAQLDAAAPSVWAELCPADARNLGISEGDLVQVESRRGKIHAPARLSGTRPGVVFVPFHYGYFDAQAGSGPQQAPSAANEVTRTEWDPVSKQPIVKVTAVRVTRLGESQ